MKHLLIILTALTLLTACSADLQPAEGEAVPEVQEAIIFEPYMARPVRNANAAPAAAARDAAAAPAAARDAALCSATRRGKSTRATALTTLESLQAEGRGFGVFAYDQGVGDIITYCKDRIDPNFMFNQQVTWQAPYWHYEPAKYWPNNPGNRLSFFAYAPYDAEINSITGSPRIVLERGYNGPAIYYNTLVPDLDHALDLCWGANATTTLEGHVLDPDHAPVNYVKNGTGESVSLSSRIKFNFKHALSRLKFNVQIFNDLLTDAAEHGNPANGGTIDPNTRIEIKDLRLVGLAASDGVLSLYDGKWNAQFETSGIHLLPYLDPTKLTFEGTQAATEADLFGEGKYLTIIPGARYKIRIEYWVITTDNSPGAHPLNSTVTKNVIDSPLEYIAEQGKAYEFHLNLGMTTVKFEASVTDWVTESHEVDLPNNHE